MDEITNFDLPSLPRIFRLTSYSAKVIDHKRTECTATLFHEKASMKVRWTTASPDTRIKANRLVSPRWAANNICDETGTFRISRLVLIERPEAAENLFRMVPTGWVRDRELVAAATELIECLPRGHRHLFNAIFWEGDRFRRFCMGPSSINGHHNGLNGNLCHAVDVARMMREGCGSKHLANTPLAILSALLHDAGKADEYQLTKNGEWKLSDRGRLLGHKVTAVEWIAVAMARHRIMLPASHYMALLHCLTASQNAPEWLGIRKPAMLEAMMISNMDRLSGAGELLERCAVNDGWGRFHPHIGLRPYAVCG